MYSDDIAIRVENLSKCYQIYDRPQDRLRQSIMPRLKRFVGSAPTQYFREFWALRDVSFEIRRGETVGIIGRNGSGKSTLLQIICGTLTPTGGRVETNGRVAALLELGSGFNPEFTGRENVYMNAAVLGLQPQEIDARYADIVAFADIGAFVDQPVKTYSSGMMVRLAFAVAINADPQILVVDEALSVGDELFQRKCFSRIEAIKEKGATILFVSHSGSTVVELCDRALLIDAGEKLAMGSPKLIVGQYQKLIYAPDEKRYELREAIRLNGSSPRALDRHGVLTEYDRQHGMRIKEAAVDELKESFDPNLKPQSTVTYESNGAVIERPEIYTLSGDKVNCLRRGGRYRYAYKVKFYEGATNVRFAMLIKTVSGLEVGGAVSSPIIGQGVSYVEPGVGVDVEFQFTCDLNPGTYFLNAGVTGGRQEGETYLHRILDACMFSVLPVAGNTATATVDFRCVPEVKVIQEPVLPAIEQ